MPDRPAKSDRPAKGERAAKPRAGEASDHDAKGTPTNERHDSETAGGQHAHHQPHTTGHPAKAGRKH